MDPAGWLPAVVMAARPKTLPAAVVPVWLACVLAKLLTGSWNPAMAAWTLAGAVSIQIATNFFNDAIDFRKGADTAGRLGPRRVTASGMLAPRAVMAIGAVFLGMASVCGAALFLHGGWPVLAIGIPSLFLAYGYTGGPYPIAYRGMGELFVLVFFGFAAVTGSVFVQTGTWPSEALLLGLQVGLLSCVLISINNFRDREEDAKSDKRTLAVRLGAGGAVGVVWLEIKIAALSGLGWIAFGKPQLMAASLPVFMTGGVILWGLLTKPPGASTNRLLALAGLQLILFAVVYHLAASRIA